MTSTPTLRVARPADDFDAILRFYRDGLGFTVIASFEDHAGFDGIMLGWPGAPYHLEFTRERGASAPRSSSPENLLVFYLPDRGAWEGAVSRMEAAGYPRVRAHNPYWNVRGATFEDPDGSE